MKTIGEQFEIIKARIEKMISDPAFGQYVDEYNRTAGTPNNETVEAAYYKREARKLRRVPASVAEVKQVSSTAAIRAIDAFLASDRLMSMLAGPGGRGKTFAIAKAVDDLGGRFYTAQEIVRISTFDVAQWDDLQNATLLAIDDLGSERGNDEADANMFAVIDARYRMLRKTLITTNLTEADFKKRYTSGSMARLHDRIKAHGIWVNVPGESMRKGTA